jgi:hypothetical protein
MARFVAGVPLAQHLRWLRLENLRNHAVTILLSIVFSSALLAQSLPPGMAGDQLGEQPYQSYHGGDIDSVGLANGTLSLNFPFLSYSQRGKLHLSFNLMYNNEPQHLAQDCPPPPGQCAQVWGYDLSTGPLPLEKGDAFVGWAQQVGITTTGFVQQQTVSSTAYSNYSLLLADGTKHVLGNTGGTSLTNHGSGNAYYLISNGPLEALDASGWQLQGPWTATGQSHSSGLLTSGVTDADGVQYGNTIQDPNGNQITNSGTTITDSLGRQIPLPPTVNSAQNASTSSCPTVGGVAPSYAVSWTVPGYSGNAQYIFCYAEVSVNIPTSTGIIGNTSTVPKLQSIVLPNGQSWQFEYNDSDGTQYNGAPTNWGTLSQVTLPTGGSISYTYSTVNAWAGLCENTGRWVASRTVNDESGAHTWQYQYTSGSPGNTKVIDPLGNYVIHTFGYQVGCALYETQTQYYDSGSNLLKTVSTTYSGSQWSANTYPNGAINVVPTSISTTLNTQTSSMSMTYDSTLSTGAFNYYDYLGNTTDLNGQPNIGIHGKKLSESDFDYGNNTTPLRTTNTSYLALTNQNYLNGNMLNLVSSVQVLNGSGTQQAYTTYGSTKLRQPLQESPNNTFLSAAIEAIRRRLIVG